MSAEIEDARRRHNEARAKLFGLKAGKHNGAEQVYGKTYDNLMIVTGGWRLKRKYR